VSVARVLLGHRGHLFEARGDLLQRAGLLRRALGHRLAAPVDLRGGRRNLLGSQSDLREPTVELVGGAVHRLLDPVVVALVLTGHSACQIAVGKPVQHIGRLLQGPRHRVQQPVQAIDHVGEGTGVSPSVCPRRELPINGCLRETVGILRQRTHGGGTRGHRLRDHGEDLVHLHRVRVARFKLKLEAQIALRQAAQRHRYLLRLRRLVLGNPLRLARGVPRLSLVHDELEGAHDAAVLIVQRRPGARDVHRLPADPRDVVAHGHVVRVHRGRAGAARGTAFLGLPEFMALAALQ